MTSTRAALAEYVSSHRADWSQFLISTYVLAHQDRIGRYGQEHRDGLPAIWGHSYVRTYNMWAGNELPRRAELEGGIATSYYVVASLSSIHRRAGTGWRRAVLDEVTAFFAHRTNAEGVGVRTLRRGVPHIEAHLRHTCFGYLIVSELAEARGAPTTLKQLAEASARVLARAVPRDKLLTEWLPESWPVGCIASYVAARDHLYHSVYADVWAPREKQRWPGVREIMLDTLARVTSTQLSVSGATKEEGKPWLDEHSPFWHPIKDAEILRLHSTLGCLALVGRDLAAREAGRQRIGAIVAELREHLARDLEGTPRFAQGAPASLAAACAMLKLVLGAWYEPTAADREFVFMVLDFIRLRWKDPEVYGDYWTEFTAPLLNLDEMFTGLDVGGLVRSGERLLDAFEASGDNVAAVLGVDDGEVYTVLRRVRAPALGLPSDALSAR
jgi:hypothetical protein